MTILGGCDDSSSSERAAGARKVVDALGRHCSEPPPGPDAATPIATSCQQPLVIGTAPTCQAALPQDATCMMGASPCWTITSIDARGSGIAEGGPPAPADGGTDMFLAVCASCCAPNPAYGGPTVVQGVPAACAGIPCKSIADCPLEACVCADGWCE
jgi:hypothetical protein